MSTREEARAAIDAVAWDELEGDPDDLQRFADGLGAWVGSIDPYDAADGCDTALELVHYLGEIDATRRAIFPVLLALLECAQLSDRSTLIAMVEEMLPWKDVAFAEMVRDQLARHLAHEDPQVRDALTRVSVTLFGVVPATGPWIAVLEELVGGQEGPSAAVALIALARAGLADRLVEPLLGRPMPPDLAGAVAFALRRRDRPLTTREREHAARFGQPGLLGATVRRLSLSDRIVKDLAPFDAIAPRDMPMEPATVVFSGAALVQVTHPQRGVFTLRIPGEGLKAGDTVLLGDFVEPPANRPLKAAWTIAGEPHEATFRLDGQPRSD
jgi:plasmid stabilization system protein ParE